MEFSPTEALWLGLTYPYTSPVADILVVLLGCGVLLGGFSVRLVLVGLAAFLIGHLLAQWVIGPLLGELLWTQAHIFSRALFGCGLVGALWAGLLPGRFGYEAIGLAGMGGLCVGALSISAIDDMFTQVLMMGAACAGSLGGLIVMSGLGMVVLRFGPAALAATAWRVLAGWITSVACVMLALSLA